MGLTTKILKSELKHIYDPILDEYKEHTKNFNSGQKQALREYVEYLSHGKIHAYSAILIKKRILEIENSTYQDVPDIVDYQI